METTPTATNKPLAQGKWLLHSIGWTLACVAGWLVLSTGLDKLLNTNDVPGNVLVLGTAGAAHLLIWYKAVLSSCEADDKAEPFWLTTLSALWTFGLLLFQVVCLIVWFLGLILACDTTSSTWN